MKKVIIMSVAGVLSFVLGTAGIYLAMPTIAPAVVDSTRIRLDSLGLLPMTPEDSVKRGMKQPAAKSIHFDPSTHAAASDSSDSLQTRPLPSGPTIEVPLEDSLRRTLNVMNNLDTDNAALMAKIEELSGRLEELESQHADAAELSKSLSKIEDRQLAGILADLDMNVVEKLYMQASARDRPRLLQNLPPDRASLFVTTLVDPAAANDDPATIPDSSDDSGEPNP